MEGTGSPSAAVDRRRAAGSLLSNVFSGVIAGAFVVSFTVSLAALVFSGDLARHLPAGLGLLLASSFILGVVISAGSAFRPITAAAQDNTGVILALIAVDIQRRAAPGADILPTLVAAIAATTMATGVSFYLLGRFRLGKVVRFIPYPVIGGFLAGTGWLLAQGSLGVMLGRAVRWRDFGLLLHAEHLLRWAPGVGFGLLLTVLLRRFKHHLLMPALLAAAFVAFYVVVVASGLGLAGAGARGLLLGPFPPGGLWPPIHPSDLARVDWALLRANAGNAGACVLLAIIAALLNASGYELATDQDVDQDRELRVHGIANLLAGAAGGAPGYLMLGGSMLSYRSGGRGRLAGLIAGGTCLVPLLAGTAVLGFFPKPVLGGLLFFLGLSFIVENVWDSFSRLPRGEYALVLLILAVVVGVGFLQGVGFGIVVSSVLFALNYARVEVVKHTISGAVLRSKASRSMSHDAILRRDGAQIVILQLQGYVFFGTAHTLLQRVKERLASKEPAKARFVVLDFRHVHGLDASAVVSFVRMKKLTDGNDAHLVLTEVSDGVASRLARGGNLDAEAVRIFPDLDRGLEWCEDEIIAAAHEPAPTSQVQKAILGVLHDEALVARLLGYFETVNMEPAQELFRAGDDSSDLYLIESGEAEAYVELPGGRHRRLRAMGPGTVVGESALYLSSRRSASVRTTERSVLLRLTAEQLRNMTSEAPEIASAFHRFIVALLADRIVSTTTATNMLFY